MKIRTKLTIFFTIIFFVLVLLLSVWYQSRLFYVLRQESLKSLDMFSRSFFKPPNSVNGEDIDHIMMKMEERINRDDFSRMISKRTWFALYDSDLNVISQTPFAREFPLENLKKIADKKYFTCRLNVDSDYFKRNKIDYFPGDQFMMESEFYTNKDNYSFNCIGEVVHFTSDKKAFFLVALFPDDKNVLYLEKSMMNVIFSLAILIGVIIVLGFFYSKYSLSPINKIIQELNNISEKDLSRRIKLGLKNKDEIAEISLSINNLLARIENAFNMEKQFISDVSHEFKTPISILQLNIDNISNNPHLTDEEIDKISSSLEILYSLNNLIQKLLYLSRLESNLSTINPQEILISDLLNSIINNLQGIAEFKNLKLFLDIKDEKLAIKGDKELLYIAFYNIIENSLKYTEKGYVLVSAEKQENSVKINIEDTGIGIPANKIGKIFDKFFRADHARHDHKSFGIGLTITKRILDIHKAEIQIKSIPGIKTKFSVNFPS